MATAPKKAAPKKAAPKKAAAKKVAPQKKYTVKPMPNSEMFAIYVGEKQTDFINTKDRCQTQADYLNSK
jgi:hypothetical protein